MSAPQTRATERWTPDAFDLALGEAAAQLQQATQVWIGTHLDPDGDAIGSLLGLGHILRDAGKHVTLASQDAPPRDAAWLPGADRLVRSGPRDEALLVSVDAADEGRLGRIFDAAAWADRPSLVIDHHVSNPGFGDLNVVDPSASSTAEIVLELAEQMALPVSVEAATCLLTGLVTDTIGFRTSNTSARSLGCAQRLVQAGASLAQVSHMVFYRQSMGALKLTGLAVERLEQRGHFALTWLDQADLARFDTHAADTREITRLVASAEEPLVVGVLRERADGDIDLSLRSKPGVSLVDAARALGGGGHPQASGARLAGPLERAKEEVLAALRAHVRVPRIAGQEASR